MIVRLGRFSLVFEILRFGVNSSARRIFGSCGAR